MEFDLLPGKIALRVEVKMNCIGLFTYYLGDSSSSKSSSSSKRSNSKRRRSSSGGSSTSIDFFRVKSFFFFLHLGGGQDQVPCGATETSPGNCQEKETSMARARHTTQQPLYNRSSGNLGGWTTPWSAEEMLDGQHQRLRLDISAHTGPARNGLLQERLGGDLC